MNEKQCKYETFIFHLKCYSSSIVIKFHSEYRNMRPTRVIKFCVNLLSAYAENILNICMLTLFSLLCGPCMFFVPVAERFLGTMLSRFISVFHLKHEMNECLFCYGTVTCAKVYTVLRSYLYFIIFYVFC